MKKIASIFLFAALLAYSTTCHAWGLVGTLNTSPEGGGAPTTDTRDPTSDFSVSGTWSGSAGTRYTLVDDYPDTVPNDVLQAQSGGAYMLYGYTAFSVPAGATGISVQVQYYSKNDGTANSTIRGRLYVGGTQYQHADLHTINGTTPVLYTDSWTTNPKTTLDWTVDDVNGVGANSLTRFGMSVPDATPYLDVTSIRVQVTYTPGS